MENRFCSNLREKSLQLRPPTVLQRQKMSVFEALLKLNRVVGIQVADVTTKQVDDGVSKHFYVIHVQVQHIKSRLPLHGPGDSALEDRSQETGGVRDPDAVVERRFSEFEQLRKAFTDEVVYPHKSYCKLCDEFLLKLVFSTSQPCLLSKLFVNNPNDRRKLLQQFLVDMLCVLQRHQTAHGSGCKAVETVPRLFHDFLFLH